MEETLLERCESIDMLRIIENRELVRMVLTDEVTFSVDTKPRLEFVESIMKNDMLIRQYIENV